MNNRKQPCKPGLHRPSPLCAGEVRHAELSWQHEVHRACAGAWQSLTFLCPVDFTVRCWRVQLLVDKE